MSAPTLHATTSEPFIDEILDSLLNGWSGLRYYISRRRNGSPSDPVMESLLAELLRLHLKEKVDIQEVIDYIETKH